MERHRQTVLRADRRSKAGIIFGIIGVTVAIIATIYAISARDTSRDVKELNEAVIADRADARVAACVQYNVQRDEVRRAVKDALVALAPPSQPLTPAQREVVDRYAAEVDAKLPYRDCTPAGLDAYFKNPPTDPALNN